MGDINWYRKGRNVSNNGTLFDAEIDGVGVGKLVYDGGFTEYFCKGVDYPNEKALIEAAEDLSERKETGRGKRYEVLYVSANGNRKVGPVLARGKNSDEAGKRALKELSVYDRRIKSGHLLVTGSDGTTVRYDINER